MQLRTSQVLLRPRCLNQTNAAKILALRRGSVQERCVLGMWSGVFGAVNRGQDTVDWPIPIITLQSSFIVLVGRLSVHRRQSNYEE